ncbi:MAG: hypothetical protein QXT73_01220 [Candidatus Methanomethylicaceae archaeon]
MRKVKIENFVMKMVFCNEVFVDSMFATEMKMFWEEQEIYASDFIGRIGKQAWPVSLIREGVEVSVSTPCGHWEGVTIRRHYKINNDDDGCKIYVHAMLDKGRFEGTWQAWQSGLTGICAIKKIVGTKTLVYTNSDTIPYDTYTKQIKLT